MRLTVFGPGHPFRGGIASTTTEMVRALVGRGHDVLFLTPERQYPRWLYPGGTDLDPEACPALDEARAVLDPFSPTRWGAARKAAVAHDDDVWIIPYWTWVWSGLWWWLLRTRRRPPVAAVVHNPADHDAGFRQRLAARRVLGRCDALFTHAGVLQSRLEETFQGVPMAHHPLPATVRWTLPARDEARLEIGVPADRRVVLFLGLIRPYKGVDLLIDAAARLDGDSDWLLLIAGEPWGDLGDRLRRQVTALKLEDRVRLDLRWVPEGKMRVLLAAADLLALPYRQGSQSAMAPLALAHGLPVLSSAVGGVPEVVKDGVNGLIVPPSDPDAIASALESLDHDSLARLAGGAHRTAGELSWSSYALALEDLIAAART